MTWMVLPALTQVWKIYTGSTNQRPLCMFGGTQDGRVPKGKVESKKALCYKSILQQPL